MTWKVFWTRQAVEQLLVIRQHIAIYAQDASVATDAIDTLRYDIRRKLLDHATAHKNITHKFHPLISTGSQSVHKLVSPPYIAHYVADSATDTATVVGIWHHKQDRKQD